MKTCVSGRTEIMWNTHRVGVTADNIARYKLPLLQYYNTLWRHYGNVCNKGKEQSLFVQKSI